MAYIKIKDLEKTYRVTRTENQDVLRGIDIEFNKGEFIALLGDSGCGKSTFMNKLGGLDTDYGGTVELNGTNLSQFTMSQMDDYRKKEVGIIFQSYNLISHMTVAENIAIALTMTDMAESERTKRTNELIAQVKMSQHANLAYRNVKQSKKRTSLVVVALAIGIAAFVLVFSIGQGLRGYVSNEVASQMNRLQIDVMQDPNGVATFDENDVNIISSFKGTGAVIPSATITLGARYKSEENDYATLLTLGATFNGFSANLKRGNSEKDDEILISSAMAARLDACFNY